MLQPSKQAQTKQFLSEGATMGVNSWSQWSLWITSSLGYSVIHPLPVLLKKPAYLILKILSSLKIQESPMIAA